MATKKPLVLYDGKPKQVQSGDKTGGESEAELSRSVASRSESMARLPSNPYTYLTKSANYTASASDYIYADSSGGVFDLTLPADPGNGDEVVILDYTESFGTNTVTVKRNGKNINKAAEDCELDVDNAEVKFSYTDATNGWIVIYQYYR